MFIIIFTNCGLNVERSQIRKIYKPRTFVRVEKLIHRHNISFFFFVLLKLFILVYLDRIFKRNNCHPFIRTDGLNIFFKNCTKEFKISIILPSCLKCVYTSIHLNIFYFLFFNISFKYLPTPYITYLYLLHHFLLH